jgi:hypothetical protein
MVAGVKIDIVDTEHWDTGSGDDIKEEFNQEGIIIDEVFGQAKFIDEKPVCNSFKLAVEDRIDDELNLVVNIIDKEFDQARFIDEEPERYSANEENSVDNNHNLVVVSVDEIPKAGDSVKGWIAPGTTRTPWPGWSWSAVFQPAPWGLGVHGGRDPPYLSLMQYSIGKPTSSITTMGLRRCW